MNEKFEILGFFFKYYNELIPIDQSLQKNKVNWGTRTERSSFFIYCGSAASFTYLDFCLNPVYSSIVETCPQASL